MLGNLENGKVHCGKEMLRLRLELTILLRAESLLKLQQLDDIDSILSHIPKVNHLRTAAHRESFLGCFMRLTSFMSEPISRWHLEGLRMQLPVLRKLGRLILKILKLRNC